MFSEDRESKVDELEITFLHPQISPFWDWPKNQDVKLVQSRFIFFGPCMPAGPTKKGFTFADEEEVMKLYRLLKNNSKLQLVA